MKTNLLGEEQLVALAEKALGFVEADQAEAVIVAHHLALTRVAESTIHQNMLEADVKLTMRAVVGKQIGCAITNRLEDEGLRAVAMQASRLARNSAPNPAFRSLPSHKPIKPVKSYAAATAECAPEQRAEACKLVIREAEKIGAIASASLSTSSEELAVANSLGVRAYQPITRAELVVIIADAAGEASGYGEWFGKDFSALSPSPIAESAAQNCAQGRGAQPIAPGEYPVILEAPAVSELLNYLAWLGLGATAFQEGRSFMCDNIGKKIAAENITLWDEGANPNLFPMAFDFEGVPKQKVMLIENGVARNVVYDSYTAGKEGKASTGHAWVPPNVFGPFPMHLCMAGGTASLSEMIGSMERGLLVSRFHYINAISPRETILTGMTRDGTFLIENGKISRPVQKLRFTESILKTLQKTEMLSREVKLSHDFLVPAIKVAGFNFTS